MNLIISCEHATNSFPEEFAPLFRGRSEILASHLGYDPGAAELARSIASAVRAPLFLAPVTRLLVDCNRSPSHPRLFSEFSLNLPPLQRESLMADWYLPYRGKVYRMIRQVVSRSGSCLHLSVHTFTPELNGSKRNADLGLLYDPSRKKEKMFCRAARKAFKQEFPALRVRYNYPYLGVSDGLVAALRKSFSPDQYQGIELELNQALYVRDKCWPPALCQPLLLLLRSPPDM